MNREVITVPAAAVSAGAGALVTHKFLRENWNPWDVNGVPYTPFEHVAQLGIALATAWTVVTLLQASLSKRQ